MLRLILIILGFMLAIAASGLPVDKITIVLGALGVGIGLGLQTIVNNLVSGIILIFEQPFGIGDYIELNGKKGVVRDIGIRSSGLVTAEGTGDHYAQRYLRSAWPAEVTRAWLDGTKQQGENRGAAT